MRTVFNDYPFSMEILQKRVREILSEFVRSDDEIAILTGILGLIDLTTLEGTDTEERVIQLCHQARFSEIKPGLPDAAAVCVYPALVRVAKKSLEGTQIKVASVAGGFPSGQTSLKVKLDEVRWALDEGADEIDMVICRGKLLEGKASEVFDEIATIRETCGKAILKVILETGELQNVSLIRQASTIAIKAGAGFIKTSTGKISAGASPETFLIMLDSIREYLEKTGKAVGIKAAGGVRTKEQALIYYRLVEQSLGENWLRPGCFRIGASSLAKEILNKI